jgi:hypothetical protein
VCHYQTGHFSYKSEIRIHYYFTVSDHGALLSRCPDMISMIKYKIFTVPTRVLDSHKILLGETPLLKPERNAGYPKR